MAGSDSDIQEILEAEARSQGADFVHFVDISLLPSHQRRGFPVAILVGLILSRTFVRMVSGIPDYVEPDFRQ